MPAITSEDMSEDELYDENLTLDRPQLRLDRLRQSKERILPAR
jgi:hypothetical protein